MNGPAGKTNKPRRNHELERIRETLDEKLRNFGTKQAHYWKQVVAAIDLWVRPNGWFILL